MTDEPMIWTSKGNLPCSLLTYETCWEDKPDHVLFVERYLLDGEVVRQSVHAYNRKGLEMSGAAG